MSVKETKDRETIILANWKANLSPAQAEKWVADFGRLYRPAAGKHIILAVPFLALPALHSLTRDMTNVFLAAQDVSPFPPGGYTGATPAAWLQGVADYVLIGHRERRRYFHETVQDAANKVSEAVAAGLHPILCLTDAEITRHLAPVDSADLERLILAYTPNDAEALEVARSRELVIASVRYLAEASGGRPVLYGGGVNGDNVADFLSIPELSGVMIARGSIDPADFIRLLHKVERDPAPGS